MLSRHMSMVLEEIQCYPLSRERERERLFNLVISDQQLIDKAFYECEQDLLVKSAIKSPLSEVLDVKNISLVAKMENVSSVLVSDVPIPKSVSSGNLNTVDMAKPEESFPGLPPGDYGMRRAFSESNIQLLTETVNNSQSIQVFARFWAVFFPLLQTLGTRNATGYVQSPLDRVIVSCTSEQLSRYRNKKSMRKIKEDSSGQSTKDPRKVCENRGDDAVMRISS